MTGERNAPPISRKVLLIHHNPIVPSAGDARLSQAMGWMDPDTLVESFLDDLLECSYGIARYQVVERVDVDDFPPKADGFRYTEDTFLASWRAGRGFHQPDQVDYHSILDELAVLERIDQRTIDEVWLMGFPYAGYYESIMAGPGAFWCNAPPLSGTDAAGRRFVVMGFNFERGVGEMLESFGHRAESILAQVFKGRTGEANLWERYIRHDLTHPGEAQVGNVHFAPNSQRDYDWGNRRYVPSYCDDWYRFPNFPGAVRQVNCEEWGNGDIRQHHRWWFRHFPCYVGEQDGISYNWWEYVLDPERVP